MMDVCENSLQNLKTMIWDIHHIEVKLIEKEWFTF